MYIWREEMKIQVKDIGKEDTLLLIVDDFKMHVDRSEMELRYMLCEQILELQEQNDCLKKRLNHKSINCCKEADIQGGMGARKCK